MVVALLVVMMVFVRLLVSFLLIILMFRMFRVFLFMERSVDVVFRDSILWILPPISAGVQVCKIDIRCHISREREKVTYMSSICSLDIK